MAEVRRVLSLFPGVRKIFFDDDTFTWDKSRVLELCQKLKPLKLTWSCNSRVTTDLETLRARAEAGCRLLVVGFESGDSTILATIKKGTTIERALAFSKDCTQAGITLHGDFQIGHPGETYETIERTVQFAMKLDPQTMQVSISHPYPGTEFFRYLEEHGYLVTAKMTDELGHQLPNVQYPGLSLQEIMRAVEDFCGRFYFRPKVILRIVRRAILDRREQKRLYKEAREFFQRRAKLKEFIHSQRPC